MMGCKRGDIYMARLSADEDGGSLQEGMRPILIISNDKANEHSNKTHLTSELVFSYGVLPHISRIFLS